MTVTEACIPRVATTPEIREHFPALSRRIAGQPVAYFDGPGGTQVPRAVVEAVTDYLVNHNANTHWEFPTSRETDALIVEARTAVADFLNATPAEVVFGANMTTLTFHLARALGRGYRPGDEIVVTELDHHANVAPWQAVERERGVTLRTAKLVPETGQLDWEDLARLINDRTRLLAIGAASNALGTINDIREATQRARQVGALTFVDAVHYAAHRLVDVRAWDCDFLACSAYKFYGPHVGVLFGKHELLQSLDVPKLLPAPDSAPERCETGTQNHEGIAGTAAAVNFLASLAEGASRRTRLQDTFRILHERGTELVTQVWAGLEEIAGVSLHGPQPAVERTPTVSFTLAGWPAIEVCRHLAARGIFASHGDFYARTVVERLGYSSSGLVRIGCACYSTAEEAARLVDAVREVARGRA